MIAILNSISLWGFGWFQLINLWPCNGIPFLCSDRGSMAALEVLHVPAGQHPWTVAEAFFGTSVVFAMFALFMTWRAVRAHRSRWRMISVTVVFAVILVGFSGSILSWKEEHRRKLSRWTETLDRGSPDLRLMDEYWGGERQRALDALARTE